MNYYEHHIRDYDTATSHLSWDEDLAYTRLIRWYYRKEKPIPADIKEACRQVRAKTRMQRQAVESVLREFFVLREDGWHNETCDEVIKKYLEGEPEREVKKANEENRLKRHREERARLFKILTDAGEHAPWNIKMEELREMVERVSARKYATAPETPATQPATAPETPATATQTPDTITHPPGVHLNSAEVDGTAVEPAPEAPAATSEELPPVARVCRSLKAFGYGDTSPHDPKLLALLEAGLTPEEIVAVGEEFKGKGKGFRYILSTAEGRRRDAKTVAPLPKASSQEGRLSPAGQATAAAAERWLESQGGTA